MKRLAIEVGMTAIVFAFGVAACGGKPSEDKPEEVEKPGEKTGHADGVVTLTEQQMAAAKVQLAAVETRSVSAEIVATGELVPPDDGVARLGGKVAGRMTRLVKGVGDRVKKGELLALIDSPELGRAKADYISAAAAAKIAKETVEREKGLYDKKISSERDWRMAEAEATKTRADRDAAELRLHTLGMTDDQLDNLSGAQHFGTSVSLTSPIDGVVAERPVSVGQMVQPQDLAFVIMDLRKVWVMVDVYERDLAQLKIGAKVETRVQAWGDRVFLGAVDVIGAALEKKSRTIKVRVVLDNADGALKPGMFAQVKLAGSTGEAREGLYVPAAAVQRDGDTMVVFVPTGERTFALRKIEQGVTTDAWIEVRHGVTKGEKVVTTGAFQLKSEVRRDTMVGED